MSSTPDNGFIKAINEKSNLACALVATSVVENALMALLGNYFVKCSSAESLIEKGALGDFFKCSTAARCLGLISAGMYKNLECVGKIRNEFAHSHEFIDFDNADVKPLCMKLTFPKVAEQIGADPVRFEDAKHSARDRFRLVSTMLYAQLIDKSRRVKHLDNLMDEWD